MRANTMRQRIQKSNMILSTLLEFGMAVKAAQAAFSKEAAIHIQEAYERGLIDEKVYHILGEEAEMLAAFFAKEKVYERRIKDLNKHNQKAIRLESIPGIGTINASILSIQPMASYESSRDYAASLGLVPKQATTGGKVRLGSITKQGNRYIRTMLIQGGRSIVMRTCKENRPSSPLYLFARKIYERKGFNVASVAVANKLARIAFACITKQEDYQA